MKNKKKSPRKIQYFPFAILSFVSILDYHWCAAFLFDLSLNSCDILSIQNNIWKWQYVRITKARFHYFAMRQIPVEHRASAHKKQLNIFFCSHWIGLSKKKWLFSKVLSIAKRFNPSSFLIVVFILTKWLLIIAQWSMLNINTRAKQTLATHFSAHRMT